MGSFPAAAAVPQLVHSPTLCYEFFCCLKLPLFFKPLPVTLLSSRNIKINTHETSFVFHRIIFFCKINLCIYKMYIFVKLFSFYGMQCVNQKISYDLTFPSNKFHEFFFYETKKLNSIKMRVYFLQYRH